jgi:hypothetical protein
MLIGAGQAHDAPLFLPLMRHLQVPRVGRGRARTRPDRVRGDKAYSSRAIRAHLRSRGITAVIPEPADQARHRARRRSPGGRPPAFDPNRLPQPQRHRTPLQPHQTMARYRYPRHHQILYGRRGTGKTHALLHLSDLLVGAGDIPIYVDLRPPPCGARIYSSTLSRRCTTSYSPSPSTRRSPTRPHCWTASMRWPRRPPR